MKVRKPLYSDVTELDLRLYAFSHPVEGHLSEAKLIYWWVLGLNSNAIFRSPFGVELRSCQYPLGTLNLNRRSKRLQSYYGGL